MKSSETGSPPPTTRQAKPTKAHATTIAMNSARAMKAVGDIYGAPRFGFTTTVDPSSMRNLTLKGFSSPASFMERITAAADRR